MSPDPEPELTLRPVTEADLGYFDARHGPDTDPNNFFGWQSTGHARRQFENDGMLGNGFCTLLVVVDGTVVGDVSWHEEYYAPHVGTPVINIGITLLPDQRGRGFGTRAQRALADYLFATYAVQRIEAHTDVDNLAEQRALIAAGFTREGVLRSAQWRGGAWHDLVVYSRLRTDT